MNAFDRYFTWINRTLDRNSKRGFFTGSLVWFFCMAMWLYGLIFFVGWFALWLAWKVLFGIYWGIRYVGHKLFGWKLPKKPVKHMTGTEFERHVADCLRARGYHDVRFTPATGDYGVDILATKHGRVYAFQCKCYTGSVGVSAVQEVYSGSRKYHADRAVVITNSKYTPNAKTLAHDLGVSLWDLEVLNSIFCE